MVRVCGHQQAQSRVKKQTPGLPVSTGLIVGTGCRHGNLLLMQFLHKGTDLLALILKTFPPTAEKDLNADVIFMEIRFETGSSGPCKSLKC